MKTRIFMVALLFAAACGAAAAIDVPLLKDLRKPVEEVEEVVEEVPVVPGPVAPSARIADPAAISPPNAVWYMAVPDATRLRADWNGSPIGKFMAEPVLAHTMRNNRFGLKYLFGDLPASAILPERVAAMSAVIDLAGKFAEKAEKMAMSGYIDAAGKFSFVFIFDVGLIREPAFNSIGEWETPFMLDNPGTTARRANHADNYIDVWTLPSSPGVAAASAVAAGFVHNMAVVSNNVALAENCLALLAGGESVATSHWGGRLSASVTTSSSADAIAYLRMDALLDGLKETPLARDAVSAWADYIGHGGREGEAVYYGLQFAEDGVRETFLLPTPGLSASSSLLEVLSRRLKPVRRWTAPGVLPYQPNPVFLFSAQLEGRTLGGLLRQERRIFGLSKDMEHFTVPPEARLLFTNDMLNILTGEIVLAFYPPQSGDIKNAPWIMVLPCTENPTRRLPRAEGQVDYNGGTIMSREKTNWRTTTCWSPIASDAFRRANGNFLVISSEGNLVINTIDQLVSGQPFTANKDFAAAVAGAESEHGLLFYYNAPEVVVREYPNLSQTMRSLYPRSSGLNSRPPLALLRRHTKGITGAITPFLADTSFTRITIQAPIPTLAALASGIMLKFPNSLRQEGRAAMEKSRENLQALWLRLQLYSSRFGHFPETLNDLAGEMRTAMSRDEIRALLTAPAALGILPPDEAAEESYTYMSGITPSDEPDIPVLYESQPWSQDFSGMYPTDPNRGAAESGDFQPYRQYIRLDGKIVTMSEKRFQSKVVKRMTERE